SSSILRRPSGRRSLRSTRRGRRRRSGNGRARTRAPSARWWSSSRLFAACSTRASAARADRASVRDVMVMLAPIDCPSRQPEKRPARNLYCRPPERVYFPASEEMPETNRHLEIRTALYLILKREFAARATIGSEQFVYWDPTTSKKRLAPDALVRLGVPHEPFRTWNTWKRGAPDLGVEVVSRSDQADEDWNEKLARYRKAGIGEVVRFDAEDREAPIRIWDLIEGDMVERAPNDPDLLACEALGLFWTVVEHPSIGP